ncbi:hypothetical protein MRX96_001775 [Rhipicephalus microplus]
MMRSFRLLQLASRFAGLPTRLYRNNPTCIALTVSLFFSSDYTKCRKNSLWSLQDTPIRAAGVRNSRRLFGAAAVTGTLLVVIILSTTSFFVYDKSKRQWQETCVTSGCVEYL